MYRSRHHLSLRDRTWRCINQYRYPHTANPFSVEAADALAEENRNNHHLSYRKLVRKPAVLESSDFPIADQHINLVRPSAPSSEFLY